MKKPCGLGTMLILSVVSGCSEVSDAEKVFHYLRQQPGVRMINESAQYGPPEELTPVTIKFFYWLDPWGVQWEMEEGRPIGDLRGISG